MITKQFPHTRRRGPGPVPAGLAARIETSLDRVARSRTHLLSLPADDEGIPALREAHASLRAELAAADGLLREATALARGHSHREWSHWRQRLTRVSTMRQQQLLAEQDVVGLLPHGTVRALDTGMSGPAIGEPQHGEFVASGTPPTYGLDMVAEYERLLAQQAVAPVRSLPGAGRVASSRGEPVMSVTELDVREFPPARRHEAIFEAYFALEPGEDFVLVNDHDPKPLYYQFAAEQAGRFSWEPEQQGPEVWSVRIGRTPQQQVETA